MRVGILTFTDGTNIGQRLQNYALQHILQNMGFEVFTIRQKLPYNYLKYYVKRFICIVSEPRKFIKEIKRYNSFEKFNKKNIIFYSRKLSFNGDNNWIDNKFDAFIVGSDQIWNPKSPYVGDNFFLKFTAKEKRYSYAPSFSIEELPEEVKDAYRERLCGFSEVSIREERGAEIIEKLTGKKAEVVLDPTLLLTKEEWNKIKEVSHIKRNDQYILSIFLGIYDKKEIDTLSVELGIQIVSIDNSSNINPSQFLELIDNATLVLTDSYHITIFSIIYHIPFINFRRLGSELNMTSRFDTLYNLLGIHSRQWDDLKKKKADIFKIDYSKIDEKIMEERNKSMNYLERTIGMLK